MSYTDDRTSAAASLGEDGMVLTLTYPGGGVYDPATGTTSGAAPSPETVAGAIFPMSAFRKAGNTMIVEGDQQLLLSAVNTSGVAIAVPKIGGTIASASPRTWTIIAVDPLSPADIDIFYDCIVRRQV